MDFDKQNWLPTWNLPSEQLLAPGSRDPLGFQRYATRFADHLLPDLTVLTNRARYYAFLAWTLDEIAKAFDLQFSAGERLAYDQYSEYLSRFERYLALSEAVQHKTDSGLTCSWVGQRRSKALVRSNRASLGLDISLTLQEGSNGVVADYRQSLQRVGWFLAEPENLPDEVTREGQELADCFRQSIKKAKADRIRDICLNLKVTSVKVEDLVKNGGLLCLSMIGENEKRILRPKLLGNSHADVVAELRPLFRRRALTESEILKYYLPSTAKTGTAFDLKQVALYQLFALTCLALFGGIHNSLNNEQTTLRLDQLIADQLKVEGISRSETLSSITNHVNWEDEIAQLLSYDDENQHPNWLGASLRLLSWIAKFSQNQQSLVVSEEVGSVSLQKIVDLFKQLSTRRVETAALAISEQLLQDHQSVFVSKRKHPWINLSGGFVQLSENVAEPRLVFPPNSVRLNSLISIYRDLQ